MNEDLMADLDRANTLVELGRAAEAIQWLETVRGEHPDASGLVDLSLAYAHLTEGRGQEALACAERAVSDLPDLPESHLMLGSVLHRIGKVRQAVAALEEAIALDPEESAPHQQLAMIHSDLKRHDRAVAAGREAVRLAPQDADAHAHLGYALHDWQPAGAIEAYRQALSLDPSHVMARHNLLSLRAAAGNYEEAVAGLADVLADAPMTALPVLSLHEIVVRGILKTHRRMLLLTVLITVVTVFSWGQSTPGDPLHYLGPLVAVAGVTWLAFRTRSTFGPMLAQAPGGAGAFLAGFARRNVLATAWAILIGLTIILLVSAILASAIVAPTVLLIWGVVSFCALWVGGVVSLIRFPIQRARIRRNRFLD